MLDNRLIRDDCADDEFGNTADADGARPESWPWPKGLAPISVRRAKLSDCRPLFQWRNEPRARRMSRNPDELVWADHVRWYERVLANPDRPIFIGETPVQRIGMVRFDVEGAVAEVSICMSSAASGKRLSQRFLEASTAEFFASHPGVHTLVAEIKPENVASLKIFERAGYQHVGGMRYENRNRTRN